MKQLLTIVLEYYLLLLARWILILRKPLIIGITGSVGKTTVKEALYHVLVREGLSVLKTEANLNTDLGIALSLFGYDHSPAFWEWPLALILIHLNFIQRLLDFKRLPPYFIVELGIDRLGNMKRMLQTVKPTIGIVTWIGEGHHLEYLKNSETIAKEKGQLLSHLPVDGLAIIPAKDPQAARLEAMANCQVAKINAVGIEAVEEIVLKVGERLNIAPAKVRSHLKSFERPKGRLIRLRGLHGSEIIDDSYNSSLPSVRLALDVLAKGKAKRKIAIFGDVLEQGQYEQRFHEEVAKLAKAKANLFIGVGKRLKKVKTDRWFASPDEAAIAIPALLREGDIVLVKGSQGMRMEKISYALAADKTEATKKLPRQNTRWRQIPFTNP